MKQLIECIIFLEMKIIAKSVGNRTAEICLKGSQVAEPILAELSMMSINADALVAKTEPSTVIGKKDIALSTCKAQNTADIPIVMNRYLSME